LPAKPGEHVLHAIVRSIEPGPEAQIAATEALRPRDIDPTHFWVDSLPRGSHVLLIDDTWTSGGHAQSAAMALHQAGAERVSLLVVARWIRPEFGNNAEFLRGIARKDYDPQVCPWTGGACP
jgi:adenine/guanine phosphoribosyltransferase-like PRPP-binding protein